ncbi:MAG TPA: DinB family protein [Bryobacteraceae bacterium]|nr:DinB family protein [Bryobacteraceae bacterium]
MKRATLALTFLLAVAAVPARAADGSITKEERQKVIDLLKESQKEFLQAVSSLSDEQWKWKPAPARWSVAECAEHIVLSEGALFGKAQEALKNPPDPDWEIKTKGKTEIILDVMAARKGRAQAPEEIVPAGKMSRAEIMAKFAEVRARTLKAVETLDAPLKAHLAPHPFPIFNPLNAYQWLLYIPLHNMRHDKQIEEVKATAGFPAK